MSNEEDFNRIYQMIRAFIGENSVAPSQKEIAACFGLSQPSICKRLHKMAEAGLLVINKRHRGIVLRTAERAAVQEGAAHPTAL
jgi:Mn-dependent DtxR family transcriptional regulator